MFWSHDFLTEFLKILLSISINTAFLISLFFFFLSVLPCKGQGGVKMYILFYNYKHSSARFDLGALISW